MSVLEWGDFGSVDPAGTEPTEGEDDFVEDDDDDCTPVGSCVGKVWWQGSEDDVDQHANTTAEGRPDHHSSSSNSLNIPDGWV